jgi:hypothetical protein
MIHIFKTVAAYDKHCRELRQRIVRNLEIKSGNGLLADFQTRQLLAKHKLPPVDGGPPMPVLYHRKAGKFVTFQVSFAGRVAIAAAAKARWAKSRGSGASANPGRKPKRKMSSAARAKMAAAASRSIEAGIGFQFSLTGR